MRPYYSNRVSEALPKVLIVDDDVLLQRIVARVVSKAGFATTVVGSGEDALESLGGEQADVVLLDLQLPQMSGIETLRRIRAAYPDVPVVVMSGRGSAKEDVEAAGTEADGYLCKPFEGNETIVRAVRHALDRNRA